MKRLLFVLLIATAALSVSAQPKARRAATKQAAQSQSAGVSKRAQLMFPTALDMPEDVVWRRDIYREIDLTLDENAGLYYPVEPIDKQLNLFTYVFKLALNGYIPVYEYRLDGNESFTDSARVKMKTILDNYHIFYEENGGKLRVDNSDIPSAEVKLYYMKESAYYDQAGSAFHIKPLAFCPVMTRDDDFGGEASKYPLFWVRYQDVEKYLNRQSVMTSNLNNAAQMTLDDFFTLHRYKGKIYKTNNMLGRTLAQYCPTDSAMTKEQARIEKELEQFEKNLFGLREVKKDSLDSIAAANPKLAKALRKQQGRRAASATKVKKTKAPKSSGGASTGARVSVRRQRH